MLHIAKLAVESRMWSICGRCNESGARGNRRFGIGHGMRRGAGGEIVAGGSLYWVVGGVMSIRQRIVDIVEDTFEDGSSAAAFVLDAELVRTEARPMRAFQGWRYLASEAAPADVREGGEGAGMLPPKLAAELRALCLL